MAAVCNYFTLSSITSFFNFVWYLNGASGNKATVLEEKKKCSMLFFKWKKE